MKASWGREILDAHVGARSALNALLRAGGNPYIVGGFLRDLFAGKDGGDVDIVVRGLDRVRLEGVLRELPGSVDLTDVSFGVFVYKIGNEKIEIALPRKARPDSLNYGEFSIECDERLAITEDLNRRDFNVNAIALEWGNFEIIDPSKGVDSILAGEFQTLASRSRREDGVKVLRGLVLAARLNLMPSDEAYDELCGSIGNISLLPSDRIHREFERIMSEDFCDNALLLAHQIGALKILLPQSDAYFDFDQKNKHHHETLGMHSLSVLREISGETSDVDLRITALLHDVGKPHTAWKGEDDVYHYYGKRGDHAEIGAKIAGEMLRELRHGEARIERIEHLINFHMFEEFADIQNAEKFARNVGGKKNALDLLKLRRAEDRARGIEIEIDDDKKEFLIVNLGKIQEKDFEGEYQKKVRRRVSTVRVEKMNRKGRGNWSSWQGTFKPIERD